MESAIWGLLGALVGAATSVCTTLLANRHSERLRSAASADERIERARSFQRNTLLELQDAFHDAIRLVCSAHLAQVRAHDAGQDWGQGLLPDEIAEAGRLANRKVMLLVERVQDDAVRSEIKTVMGEANAVPYCRSKSEASAALDRVTFQSTAALETVGKTLRALY